MNAVNHFPQVLIHGVEKAESVVKGFASELEDLITVDSGIHLEGSFNFVGRPGRP
jgi:hypothetical protein